MKLSKTITAKFSHEEIVELLAKAVSAEAKQTIPPSAVTIEIIESRFVSAIAQFSEGAEFDAIPQQNTPPVDVVEEETEAPAADTSTEEAIEEVLSGPSPVGASDSGVKDPEPAEEKEAAPKPIKKATGLNFKKTKPPVPEDNQATPGALFKFAKKNK